MCGIAVIPRYDHLSPDQYQGEHKWHCLQMRDSMVVQVWVGTLFQQEKQASTYIVPNQALKVVQSHERVTTLVLNQLYQWVLFGPWA